MLDEYALEPVLLNNWHDFRYFMGQFGVDQGRLISRYPKRWKRMVFDSVLGCGDVERTRIEEGLRRIDDRLLPRMCQWNPDADWLTNAEKEHLQRPFHAIVARTNPRGNTDVMEGESIDETNPPALWVARRSVVIKRAATDMAKAVATLLRISNEVLFIDRFFRPNVAKYLRPFDAFVRALVDDRRGAMPQRVEIHIGDQLEAGFFQMQCHARLPALIPSGLTVQLIRWKHNELHNRYIITDRGGVQFGHGLDDDDGSGTGEDVVTLLDRSVNQKLMHDYSAASTGFTRIDDLTIAGTRPP